MEIPSYFRRYLREIQPTRASRERAIQLHTTLRTRLAADQPSQGWYDGAFLYGSYARNTAIQPIKDVDICVLLNIDPDDHRPQAVIDRLRRVLERNRYDAKTALQRRSVRIDMSGTTLDVVPVVEAAAADDPLQIPDRPLKKWVDTHPRGHLAVATQLNKDSNGRYIPFVKIVKAWYRYQAHDIRGIERPVPKGFTLEALVAHYQDADAPSYAEAFVNFLSNLWSDCGAGLRRGVFPAVPDPGMPGELVKLHVEPDEAILFGEIVQGSLKAARKALEEYQDDVAGSAIAWNAIFGPKFPTVPATMNRSLTKAAFDVEDVEDEVDEEVREIDLSPAPRLGQLSILARTASTKGGLLLDHYHSSGRPLPKHWWLRFEIAFTDVRPPYEIRWIVQNHGREAEEANAVAPRLGGNGEVQWESTLYRGSHTMLCELRRNGTLLARAKHVVNIR